MATKKTATKAVAVKEESYIANNSAMESFAEEMDGMTPTFERVKIPSGGGLAFELPGEDPDSPDMAKEFKAVILHHHPINVYYREKYDGSNNPPDCGSMDGKIGIDVDGVVNECSRCPSARFGSAEDGKGKACKNKRRIYILRDGDMFPSLMTLPTGSLQEFSKYIMRLLNKGKKSNSVVTKFSLKKAQNSGGINYSQAVFTIDRELTSEEFEVINLRSEQIKAMANSTEMTSEE